MKTICIDARLIDSSGIGTCLYNLLHHLQKAHFKIYALVKKTQEPFFKESPIEKIIVNAPIYSIKEQWELSRKIPSCDLFFSPHYNIPLLPIKAKKRLTTIHDVYHLAFYSSLRLLEKAYASVVIRSAFALSDQVITSSYFSKSEMQKYTSVDPKKITVIYPGVDHQARLDEKSGEKKRVLPERFILFVGNLKPHKNLPGLVKAFSLLSEKHFSDLHLVIVGQTEGFKHQEDRQALLRLAKKAQSRIHFLGKISDQELFLCYQKAQALVLPSFYEGFGFPPLEAMRFSCPALVSSAGSLPEICGQAAYYFNPHFPQEIKEAIETLLKNPLLQEDLKTKGKIHIQNYDWARSQKAHLDLIEQLVNA